ncbi:hypothetical protein H4582DRAFT_2054441 [Lactarius indigo]|nr:hypothetical protein H4582DRAFT_2054441 [Lactarius indigo]
MPNLRRGPLFNKVRRPRSMATWGPTGSPARCSIVAHFKQQNAHTIETKSFHSGPLQSPSSFKLQARKRNRKDDERQSGSSEAATPHAGPNTPTRVGSGARSSADFAKVPKVPAKLWNFPNLEVTNFFKSGDLVLDEVVPALQYYCSHSAGFPFDTAVALRPQRGVSHMGNGTPRDSGSTPALSGQKGWFLPHTARDVDVYDIINGPGSDKTRQDRLPKKKKNARANTSPVFEILRHVRHQKKFEWVKEIPPAKMRFISRSAPRAMCTHDPYSRRKESTAVRLGVGSYDRGHDFDDACKGMWRAIKHNTSVRSKRVENRNLPRAGTVRDISGAVIQHNTRNEFNARILANNSLRAIRWSAVYHPGKSKVNSNDLDLPPHLALSGISMICAMKREIYMDFASGSGNAPVKGPTLAAMIHRRDEAEQLMGKPSKQTDSCSISPQSHD